MNCRPRALFRVLSAAAALAASVVAVRAELNWRTFTEPGGRYSILMPAETKADRQVTSVDAGEVVTETQLARVEDPVRLFLASVTEYPTDLPVEDELVASRDNFAAGVKATVVSSRRFTYQGFEALEARCKSERFVFRTLLVFVNKRFTYQIVVGFPPTDEVPEFDTFINSLKILKP